MWFSACLAPSLEKSCSGHFSLQKPGDGELWRKTPCCMNTCVWWDAHYVCVRYPTPDLSQLVVASLPLAPRTSASVFPELTGPQCGWASVQLLGLDHRVPLEVDGSKLRTRFLSDTPHFMLILRRRQMWVRLRVCVRLQDAEQHPLESSYTVHILSGSQFKQCLKWHHLKCMCYCSIAILTWSVIGRCEPQNFCFCEVSNISWKHKMELKL